MADKTRVNLVLLVKRGSRGTSRKLCPRSALLFRTTATPRVNRWTDIVCRCDAATFQPAFQNEVKDVEINADESIDTPVNERCR